METKRYPYRPGWMISVLCIFGFAATTFLFTNWAITNNSGVVINHVIELEPRGATTLYWVLAASQFMLVAAGALGILIRLTSDKSITVGDTWIEVPKPRWSRESIRIAFDDINQLEDFDINGTKIVRVHFSSGKVDITSAMLPGKNDYDEIRQSLATAMKP